jgi:Ca2+-transporting ATPase
MCPAPASPDPSTRRPGDTPFAWHAASGADAVARLHSDADRGLDPSEATTRLDRDGPNELAERGRRSVWRMLWEQVSSTLVVVLIVAGIMSAALGDLKDALAIFIVVVLNSALGMLHEQRAEKAMALLKRLAVPIVKIRREGVVREIASRELVAGDIILLEVGNLVPSDGRLLECANLRTQESSLTGESEPVDKTCQPIPDADADLGDRLNMVYMGTTVAYGRGQAIVVATGMRTELGHIADLMQSVEREPTPLQRRLDQLGRYLAILALGLVTVIFVEGVLQGFELRLMILTAVSMAVAAVPEGLPAVVTIALALGAQRMLKRNVLIRKLPAVETLGSVTVICSDKTGTLTENVMTVTAVQVAGKLLELADESHEAGPAESSRPAGSARPAAPADPEHDSVLALMFAGVALCNDAVLEAQADKPGRFRAIGDPTEGALVVASARFGLLKPDLDARYPRVAEAPFDSDRKRMTTVHEISASPTPALGALRSLDPLLGSRRYVAFTKGATEPLLQVATAVWADTRVQPLSPEWRSRIMTAHDSLAGAGMRVLGLGFRMLDGPPPAGQGTLEHDVVFVGLAGMTDPPRPEVKDAVATCRGAGVRALMVTGDHPLTARHVALELGMSTGEPLVTGHELEHMPDPALREIVEHTSVFARVSPEHKLRIVQALQARHQVVAMTGDGVNDAPALRQADIGVAMGITGTEVSKEAADMVLLDDNFATIVAAVEEGRVIYDNIRKFILYLLTSNTGELWVMILAPLAGMPLALLPLQILWINLITDGLPALALSIEPPEAHAMLRPPIPPTETILGRGLLTHIAWGGLLLGLTTLGMGYAYWAAGHAGWQTMTFTTLTLSQLGLVLTVRSSRDSFFTIGPFTNTPLLLTVVVAFLLQMMITYVPFWQDLLKLRPLTMDELGVSLLVATVPFWAFEIQKWIARRRAR